MLDSAYKDIKENSMMPEEFKNKDIPHFTLQVNVPCLPAETKLNSNKGYNHIKEHGKKAFHYEVAKEDTPYFKFLSNHAHQLWLKNKYFVKFAKFTTTLGNNAHMSDCVRLCCCIQGHLNFHLSSTSITINGIEVLDASEILWNPADKKPIRKFTLRDLLYQIKLNSNAPLFLQLSQCSLGEVNAVIHNTPKVELMAKGMNVQIAAWCHFYWKEMNPGADRFYRKLSDRAFNQVLLHEINKCTWDPSLKAVTLPKAQTEMATILDFEQQDWVKQLTQKEIPRRTTKKHVDPNVAFPFQDDFSVRTIHGANAKATIPSTLDIVEIQDNKDNINVLTAKIASGAQSEVLVGSRVASNSNPVSGPTTNSTPPGATGDGLDDPASAGPGGRAKGGPIGK